MKSIQAKLFLSIGAIFLIVALVSYLVPRFFIRKDIDEASSYLNSLYTYYQNKIQNLSQSWVTYRFVNEAAQLTAISENLRIEKKALWNIAASIINQDPEIAIVQVTDQDHQTAIISQESGKRYVPLWQKDSSGQLWIKLPNRSEIFRAVLLPKEQPNLPNVESDQLYLLFKEKNVKQVLIDPHFISFEDQNLDQKTTNSKYMYETLKIKENQILEKANLIEKLALAQPNAAGILCVNSSFKTASAYLSEEIFFTQQIVDTTQSSQNPFVISRCKGIFVDLMEFATQQPPFIVLGYSLSTIAAEIAKTIQKPVLIYNQGTLLQAFSAEGNIFDLTTLAQSAEKIAWKNVGYIPTNVQLGALTFAILIPEGDKTAIQRVLSQVRDTLVSKISYNLLLLALLLLVASLIVLARLSKKITQPITQLALASEEIGKGKYVGLDLPLVEKRHDEVAVLSHSFQQMVRSLQDREHIRGVLNKVVSKEIAAKILNSNIELGGELRTLTMLFSDIRGFTPLSETLPPQKLIGLLNAYMTRMCRIIDATHGVVDKFVGDEIMALYGAPLDIKNHAEKAIESALAMIADLKRWNEKRGSPQISIGIGIHTGNVFAGNMGAENRLNYTVVGANVNLAARLCSAATPMQILISEQTYSSLADVKKFDFQKLPPIMLKGIDSPVPIYQVL